MADISQAVTSVEENKYSVELAREVKRLNNIKNINLYCQDS